MRRTTIQMSIMTIHMKKRTGIIYRRGKMKHIYLLKKMGVRVETKGMEGDKNIMTQMDMAMERVLLVMLLSPLSRLQAQRCLMEPEDLHWGEAGHWLPIDHLCSTKPKSLINFFESNYTTHVSKKIMLSNIQASLNIIETFHYLPVRG